MENDQNFHINPESIRCVFGDNGLLGQGVFTTTLTGFYNGDECVALKCWKIPKGRVWKNFVERKIMKETKYFAKHLHENLLKIVGWTSFCDSVSIITEYHAPGNLLLFLIFDHDINVSLKSCFRFCEEISCGISFLHSCCRSNEEAFAHGSLKLDNILLDQNLRCKIADYAIHKVASVFGLKSLYQNQMKNESTLADVIYASPQRLVDASKDVSHKDDVYSFAIILRDILTRRPVLSCLSNANAYVQMIKDGNRPNLDKIRSMTTALQNQKDKAALLLLEKEIKNCWQHDPLSRPDMSEVHKRINEVAPTVDLEEQNKETREIIRHINFTTPSLQLCECIPLVSYFSAEYQTLGNQSSIHLRQPPSGASSSDESTESSGTTEVKQLYSNSIDLPTSNGQANASTTQTDVNKLLQKIQETEKLLKGNFVTKAATTSKQLTSIECHSQDDDAQMVLKSIYSLTEQFLLHCEADTVLSLLQWALKLCKRLPYNNDSVRMKRKIVEIMFSVVNMADHNATENVAIPLLNEIAGNIRQSPQSNESEKRYVTTLETRCLCCIAHARNKIGQSQQAIKICREAENLMISVFKDDAKKNEDFALCFSEASEAYYAMDQQREGQEQMEQALKVFNIARKFSTDENTLSSN